MEHQSLKNRRGFLFDFDLSLGRRREEKREECFYSFRKERKEGRKVEKRAFTVTQSLNMYADTE